MAVLAGDYFTPERFCEYTHIVCYAHLNIDWPVLSSQINNGMQIFFAIQIKHMAACGPVIALCDCDEGAFLIHSLLVDPSVGGQRKVK